MNQQRRTRCYGEGSSGHVCECLGLLDTTAGTLTYILGGIEPASFH
jgi:serine phosphatase RsbU (regulator of sigma subunit)